MKLLINLQYDFEYKGYVADCLSLPGCMSQGKTKTEALKNIREAIRGYVKVLKKHHQTAPLQVLNTGIVEVTV
ncbi:MAG: type II toxin-antitoxin system HicB family antitoxin [Candidatus Portnoybacteria bacterium]|nr:type II toxin-antitoxin system HicB family antitoxin [Candidatus Portnoybacteria bacterium]